jgi:hypothetical protein
MNTKSAIVKQILDSGIYKQEMPKKKTPLGIRLHAKIVAIRFLPAIISEVIKHGRR